MTVGTVRELPPRGHYLAHEIGWLAGVSGNKIGQWARRGLIRSSQSDRPPRVYSYQDAAEAIAVHELLEKHTTHAAIRNTIAYLRKTYSSDWPLSHAELAVRDPQLRHRKSSLVVVDGEYEVSKRQGVLTDTDLVRIAVDLRRGGWAVRELSGLEHIEVDPDRLSGKPAIKGRRLAVVDVARLAESEEGMELLLDDYELRAEEIDDAKRWWRAVQVYESGRVDASRKAVGH